jgi:hypothetical protein
MISSIGGDATVQAIGLMTSAEGGELRPGQRFAARVVEMLEGGEILLELGQNRAVVSANGLLRLGDRVVLEVVVGGVKPEFRILTDKTYCLRSARAGPSRVRENSCRRVIASSSRWSPAVSSRSCAS